MSDLASLIADLVRAGVDPVLVGRVAQVCAQQALTAPAPASVDEQAQRRRAADRERKRLAREQSGNVSAEILGNPQTPQTSAETPLLDKEKSPTPPKEINPTPPPVRPLTRTNVPTPSKSFDQFWSAYPRKVGKGDARKAFAKALGRIEAPDPLARIMAALDTARQAWADTEAQFIPHASTWLNQDRWDDDPLAKPELPPPKATIVTPEWLAARMPKSA